MNTSRGRGSTKNWCRTTEKQPYAGVPSTDYEDSHSEKAWKKVPSPYILVLLAIYLLLGYLVQLNEDAMPAVIKIADVSPDDTGTFSEESGMRYLDIILGDAPRVAGTPYHLNKTVDLKNVLDDIASKSVQRVMTDWQFVSGDYWIEFKPPYVNSYTNLSNIVAVLVGESGTENDTLGSSLLVNCHYDSVPYAIGASDNGLFCAAMVEVLSRLSKRRTKLKHNVIFLFNGAEENPLQGSHGFLSHPWAKGVTNVINLDAGGMNGKPILFQVTDPRLLSAYSKLRRPNAQSIGQFLYSTGIVPSDTDFRIWKQFGGIQGIDMVFIKWGHVYHTRNDKTEYIKPGVMQNAGNDLITLILNIADDERFSSKTEPDSAVYYDVLNLFMITYSMSTAMLVDVSVCLLSLLTALYYLWLVGFRWSSVQELGWSILGRVLSVLGGVIVVAAFTALMVATTVQIRYLSRPWLVVPLYWIPFFVTAVCVAHGFDAWRTRKTGLNRSIRCIQAHTATRVLLTVLLLLMLVSPSLSHARYIFSTILLCMSVGSLVSITLVRYVRMSGWQHLTLEVLLSLLPTLFAISLSLRVGAVMLPVMGRTPRGNPDYIIAAISILCCVLVALPVSGTELLFSSRRLLTVASVACVAIPCVAIMFIPFSPYEDDGVAIQRHHWFHTEIKSFTREGVVSERESGVLVSKWDVNNVPAALAVATRAGLNSRWGFHDACDRHPTCNLPIYRPRFTPYLKDSLFIYTDPPHSYQHYLNLRNKTCEADLCHLHFDMTGAAHNTLVIHPYNNTRLVAWSLHSAVRASTQLHGRDVFVIVHSTATWAPNLPALPFSLTFNVSGSDHLSPVTSVSHHAHLIHAPDLRTDGFNRLLHLAPKYFDISSTISYLTNYIF
ncbi:endoplasmic reticulum metallopeptidase 1-like isoform X2 [Leptidea sinapis]|uniref:endoplasmic reticulum metallopeptidase 1-like isoform X2 n=1 Tax=Leptidea sinapis TaxID=189913 RepID=UPI0021254734|nr:endoplasmic reticulum metallopeptidase 1-like isoform X2 [Leptidea sinapis]